MNSSPALQGLLRGKLPSQRKVNIVFEASDLLLAILCIMYVSASPCSILYFKNFVNVLVAQS